MLPRVVAMPFPLPPSTSRFAVNVQTVTCVPHSKFRMPRSLPKCVRHRDTRDKCCCSEGLTAPHRQSSLAASCGFASCHRRAEAFKNLNLTVNRTALYISSFA